ncbi:hypothetical protein CL622_04250 [archaeon]|nr:hypothetical protein [archaeon]|tara:strand:- start:1514 stop:1768 length:255 start_codon:yes stop_codon:yes gene_type:complete
MCDLPRAIEILVDGFGMEPAKAQKSVETREIHLYPELEHGDELIKRDYGLSNTPSSSQEFWWILGGGGETGGIIEEFPCKGQMN